MIRFFLLFPSSAKKILVLLGVTFLNFWVWRILQINILLAAILIFLTFFLFKLVTEKKFRIWIFCLTFILFSLSSFIIIRSDFDNKLLSFTPEDQVKLNERHFYYAKDLGRFFLNSKVLNYYKNYSLPVHKFEGNLFSNLDLNLYFFASHPRERAGVSEFEKYSPLYLPFFIIGVLVLIYLGYIGIGVYLIAATLASAFVSSSYIIGPILFFPLINICITQGLIYTVNFVKDFKR